MIGLLATTEVRWFSPGEIPDDIQIWFNTLGISSIQPTRTDIYFSLNRSGIGIKLREGRVEFKVRRTSYGSKSFAPGVSGQVEAWVKWGFRSPGGFRSGLPVDKARQMIFYQVTGDGEVIPSTLEVLPDRGGGVELTQVWLKKSPWWTVGIEVFGPRQKQTLEAIAIVAFTAGGGLELTSDKSASYPTWLVELNM